jgi:hypothetical protein
MGTAKLTISSHSPRHANLSMTEGEDFGTISERHRPLSRRVKRREDKDKQRHESDVRCAGWVNQHAAACHQQAPSHVRESKQQQTSSAEFVDRPDGGPGKDEIGETESPGEE